MAEEPLLVESCVGLIGGTVELGGWRDDSIPVFVVILPLGDDVANVLERAAAAARAGGRRGRRRRVPQLPQPLAAQVQLGVASGCVRCTPVARRQKVVVPRLVAVCTHRREVRVGGALR